MIDKDNSSDESDDSDIDNSITTAAANVSNYDEGTNNSNIFFSVIMMISALSNWWKSPKQEKWRKALRQRTTRRERTEAEEEGKKREGREQGERGGRERKIIGREQEGEDKQVKRKDSGSRRTRRELP